jgi:hypothetical protein
VRCFNQYCNLNFSPVYSFLNRNIINVSFSLGISVCCVAILTDYHRKNNLVTSFTSFYVATYFDQFGHPKALSKFQK